MYQDHQAGVCSIARSSHKKKQREKIFKIQIISDYLFGKRKVTDPLEEKDQVTEAFKEHDTLESLDIELLGKVENDTIKDCKNVTIDTFV